MKKTIVCVITILILISGFATQSYASLSDTQSAAIHALLDDARRISGVPGMSISILADDEMFYFSSGYADRKVGCLQVKIHYMSWPRSVKPSAWAFCCWRSKGCCQ